MVMITPRPLWWRILKALFLATPYAAVAGYCTLYGLVGLSLGRLPTYSNPDPGTLRGPLGLLYAICALLFVLSLLLAAATLVLLLIKATMDDFRWRPLFVALGGHALHFGFIILNTPVMDWLLD